MLYAILLLILGIILVVLEILLPSGGAISLFATAAIVGSLVLAFMHSSAAGFAFVVIILVSLPLVIYFGFKVFPSTSFGRKVILTPVVEAPAARGAPGVSDVDYSPLVGKTGRTVTALRPAGLADIAGERYSVVAEGQMLDAGIDIVVAKVEGNNIVVDRIGA